MPDTTPLTSRVALLINALVETMPLDTVERTRLRSQVTAYIRNPAENSVFQTLHNLKRKQGRFG